MLGRKPGRLTLRKQKKLAKKFVEAWRVLDPDNFAWEEAWKVYVT